MGENGLNGFFIFSVLVRMDWIGVSGSLIYKGKKNIFFNGKGKIILIFMRFSVILKR